MSSTEKKSEQDSTKLVEHVQFVHFSLVVIAIAMLAILTLDQHAKISAAAKQAKEVKEIIDIWKNDWLVNHYKALDTVITANENELAQSFFPDGYMIVRDHPILIKEENIILKFSKASVFITEDENLRQLIKKSNGIQDDKPEIEINDFLLDKPINLGQFMTIWDGFKEPHYSHFFRHIPNNVFIQKGSNALVKVESFSSCPGCSAQDILRPKKISDAERSIFSGFKSLPEYQYINSGGQDYQIRIPVTAKKVEFNFHSILLDFCADRGVKPSWNANSDFEEIAPELSELAKKNSYNNIPIDDLQNILRVEVERSREKLSAFSITIPAEGLRIWGSFTLVIIQLYLCLHLLMLNNKISDEKDPGLSVPWIGIYPLNFTAYITFVSAALLPVCTVTVATVTDHDLYTTDIRSLLFNVILIVASLVLSVFTAWTYFQVWRRIKNFFGKDPIVTSIMNPNP
jgi:hypothetical protein